MPPKLPAKRDTAAYRVLRGINYDSKGRLVMDPKWENKRAEIGDIIHDFPEHLAAEEIASGVLELVEE